MADSADKLPLVTFMPALASDTIADDVSSVQSFNSIAKMGSSSPRNSGADHDQVAVVETTPMNIPVRILLYVLCLGVGALYLTLFSGSKLGYGAYVYRTLSEQYSWAYYTGIGSVAFAVTLFCADVRYWHGSWVALARFLVITCLFGFAFTALLLTREYPAAPIAIYLLFVPIGFAAIKHLMLKSMSVPVYLTVLMRALILMSVCSIGYWVYELHVLNRFWIYEVKLELYEAVRCDTTNLQDPSTDGANTTDTESDCTSAFLLWMSPMILGIAAGTFALVLFFLTRAYKQEQSGGARIDPVLQFFISIILLGMLGLWVASSIAGAEMGISDIVLALSFLSMMISGAVAVTVFGVEYLREQVHSQPLGHRILVSANSDWAKALGSLLVAPFFVIFLVLSVLNQASRKYFHCTKTMDMDPDEAKHWQTKEARRLVKAIRNWDWSSVFTKIMWVCVGFVVLMVGVGRVVTVFMSWLNEQLAPFSLVATTFIFYATGLTMFLLPPVPGVPVYVTGGIILTSSARDSFGFWGAVAFTTVVCFTIKLIAVAIQQKIIGEYFGASSVKVRSLVGINSLQIRAVRRILETPGLGFAKVMVLIGGPDWPTSVLTGILRLPLRSMLLGSLPVFFLIAPCCVAGSLLLRKNDGGIWESMASIALALAFVVQSFALLSAAHFIEKKAAEMVDEEFTPDEQVLVREKKGQAIARRNQTRMAWGTLPIIMKIVLMVGVFALGASCYIFQLFASRCFVSFGTTDTIADVLDGSVVNMVKPLGWYGLALFGVGCVALIIVAQYKSHGKAVVTEEGEEANVQDMA